MKRELETKLVGRFPRLLPPSFQRVADDQSFWCKDGWFRSIWQLCEDLEKLENARWSLVSEEVKARLQKDGIFRGLQIHEVRQEWGKLYIRAEGCIKEMQVRIRKAEKDSLRICESCGRRGRLCEYGGRLVGSEWTCTVAVLCRRHRRRLNGRIVHPLTQDRAPIVDSSIEEFEAIDETNEQTEDSGYS